MPNYEFKCEVCGQMKTAWRSEEQALPRFCSRKCMTIGMGGQTCRPQKYIIDERAHEIIKKTYQGQIGNGEVGACAKRLNIPRWKITQYASRQCWNQKNKKERRWSEEEIKILKRHAMHCPEYIRGQLKKAGYKRTTTGIELKRKRLRMISNLDGCSANSLAICLGEDVHFVTRAIKNGDLKASRRKTNRTQRQGGDIFYIRHKNIKDWIVENVARINLKKVDKYWFVDLLTNNIAV